MGYLKRFYEEHHFEEMVPYEPAEMEKSISPFANKLAAATISRDKTRLIRNRFVPTGTSLHQK